MGENLKVNQVESFLTCENRSLGEEELPCLQERGGHMALAEFIPMTAHVYPVLLNQG